MTTRNPLLDKVMKAAANAPNTFICDEIAPPVDVKLKRITDDSPVEYVFDYKREGDKTMAGSGGSDGIRAKGQLPTMIPSFFEDVEGSVIERTFGAEYDLEHYNAMETGDRRNRDERDVKRATNALMLLRERLVYTVLSSASVYTNGVTGAAGSYWDDDTVDPTEQFVTAMGTVGSGALAKPNLLVLGLPDAYSLAFNPFIRALKGDRSWTVADLPALLRDSIFALSSDIRAEMATDFRIRIVQTREHTTNVARTLNAGLHFSGFSWLGHVASPDAADLEEPSAIYQARIRDMQVDQWPSKDMGLQLTKVSWIGGPIVPNAKLGYLFSGMTENPRIS